jgi:Tfp pilus assembly protein FimT
MQSGRNNVIHPGPIAPGATPFRCTGAFTLVEMVVVMTLMVIVISVAAPSFGAFMHGHNTDNEAQRFLSLTDYASSRAINEGLPMDLGLNIKQGKYWVAACGGYTETHTNMVGFNLDSSVAMHVDPPITSIPTTQSNVWTPYIAMRGFGLPTIRFQPDGFISDTSPGTVKFRQSSGNDLETWVVENSDHRRYDISPGHPRSSRF